MSMVGFEELDDTHLVGPYLNAFGNGRYIVLRGKYKGSFLDTIPKGYIRKFVLTKWVEDMTPYERTLFTAAAEEEEETMDRQPNDPLRTRANSLELVNSYLVVGEQESANAAFKRALFEAITPQLQGQLGDTVTVTQELVPPTPDEVFYEQGFETMRITTPVANNPVDPTANGVIQQFFYTNAPGLGELIITKLGELRAKNATLPKAVIELVPPQSFADAHYLDATYNALELCLHLHVRFHLRAN
jgi:hypothetical protein